MWSTAFDPGLMRSSHDKLKLANSCWQTQVGVVHDTKAVGKPVGKLLATNRTCFYSRQLFHQLFRVGKLISDVWTIGQHLLLTVHQSKQALYSRDLFTLHFIKMADPSQATFNLSLEEVRNCAAVGCVVCSVESYQNKQKQVEELTDKSGYAQTFLLSAALCFFSSLQSPVSLFYVTATELRWPCCKLLYVVIRPEFDVWRNEFANLSLPCEGRL